MVTKSKIAYVVLVALAVISASAPSQAMYVPHGSSPPPHSGR